MPAKGRPVLGVDINPHEIRVVEMRGNWSHAEVLNVGAISTPPGAMEGDRIVNPDAVADALRGLLHQKGIGARDVVMGLAARSVITRVIDVPRVPEKELRTVIEGEMAHYQILREGAGTFDFMRLEEPEEGTETNPQVLLMAAEDMIVEGYREAAERAGLRLIALEPVLLSMYRATYLQAQMQPTVACLSITYGKAEIAIMDHGQLRLYRRVDTGSDDLLTGRKTNAAAAGRSESSLLFNQEEEEAPAIKTPQSYGAINSSAANNLAIELQRSIEYYRREYPQSGAISHVLLATNDPELEALSAWLTDALSLELTVVAPPTAMAVTPDIGAQLSLPAGLSYLGAAGLAMQELVGYPKGVPRFDLSSVQRATSIVEHSRRRMTFALAAAVTILLFGVGAAFAIGGQANTLYRELTQQQQQLAARQQEHQAQVSFMQTQQEQLNVLQAQGFPFPRIVDAAASAVDPKAGLTDFSLDQGGRLLLAGDAASEKAIIKTLDGLRTCQYFDNPSLDSFDSNSNSDPKGRTVRFQISSQLAGFRGPAPAASSGQ